MERYSFLEMLFDAVVILIAYKLGRKVSDTLTEGGMDILHNDGYIRYFDEEGKEVTKEDFVEVMERYKERMTR